MADIKKLLEKRKVLRNKRPHFRREGYGARKRITEEWRKPKGRHSKIRHGFAGRRRKVMPGFGTNRLVKGLDQSGLIPIVIHTLAHIALLNKAQHGAIIGGNVGNRKRLLLLEVCKKQGITVLNLKENHAQKITESIKQRKQAKEEKEARKSEKKAKKHEKKTEEKKELTAEEKEVKEKQEKDKVLHKKAEK
jgi:large subunit ribosomal protein L32e